MNKTIQVDTQNIKFADTNTTINIQLFNDAEPWFDKSYTPIVKFSAISSADISEVTGTWVNSKIIVDSGSLVGIPVDEVRVEVWLVMDAETLIFPSEGFGRLNINYNSKGVTA